MIRAMLKTHSMLCLHIVSSQRWMWRAVRQGVCILEAAPAQPRLSVAGVWLARPVLAARLHTAGPEQDHVRPDIKSWLRTMGLEELTATFEKEELYHMDELLRLDEQDLMILIPKMGPRKRFKALLNSYKDKNPAARLDKANVPHPVAPVAATQGMVDDAEFEEVDKKQLAENMDQEQYIRAIRLVESALSYKFKKPELLYLALFDSPSRNKIMEDNKISGDGAMDVSVLSKMKERRLVVTANVSGILGGRRLEFIGDSVLSMITRDFIASKFTHATSGELTQIISGLISNASLQEVALELQLDVLLSNLGFGKLQDPAAAVQLAKDDLAQLLEALFAAAYLDSGLDGARKIILPILEQSMMQEIIQNLQRVRARPQLASKSSGATAKKTTTSIYVASKSTGVTAQKTTSPVVQSPAGQPQELFNVMKKARALLAKEGLSTDLIFQMSPAFLLGQREGRAVSNSKSAAQMVNAGRPWKLIVGDSNLTAKIGALKSFIEEFPSWHKKWKGKPEYLYRQGAVQNYCDSSALHKLLREHQKQTQLTWNIWGRDYDEKKHPRRFYTELSWHGKVWGKGDHETKRESMSLALSQAVSALEKSLGIKAEPLMEQGQDTGLEPEIDLKTAGVADEEEEEEKEQGGKEGLDGGLEEGEVREGEEWERVGVELEDEEGKGAEGGGGGEGEGEEGEEGEEVVEGEGGGEGGGEGEGEGEVELVEVEEGEFEEEGEEDGAKEDDDGDDADEEEEDDVEEGEEEPAGPLPGVASASLLRVASASLLAQRQQAVAQLRHKGGSSVEALESSIESSERSRTGTGGQLVGNSINQVERLRNSKRPWDEIRRELEETAMLEPGQEQPAQPVSAQGQKTARDSKHSDTITHRVHCPACDKSFATRATLNCHLKNKHTITRRVHCPACNKALSSRDSVNRHLVLKHPEHADVKTCGECGAKFWKEVAHKCTKA
eukprot:g48892.t1